jgi:nucleotide-binding universal stress UspA family protein
MLQDFMDTLREQYPDNECLANAELMVISGIPATRIAEIARRTGAVKIIMGSSTRGNLSKLITGSISDSVIRHSPVPVTIIHTNGTILQHGKPELPATSRVETCSPGCLQ